ncbi:hypothetical protein KSS87_003204 [Heliosperma pusillum]|nr:hypothetical protein KSS87_003204 [Heliosperma pusillum]
MEQVTESDSGNTIQPSMSSSSSQQQHRSILAIDLNEIPSPQETLPPSPSSSTTFLVSPTSLVRSIHANPAVPEGCAAEIPDAAAVLCSACAVDASSSDRLVCDACDRAFHFSCATAALSDDWLCNHCLSAGVSTRRWLLGRRRRTTTVQDAAFHLLDINASPPTDAHLAHSSGYASAGALSYPESMHSGNGFGFQKASSVIKHTMTPDFQDILRSNLFMSRSFEDVGHGSQLGRIRSSNTPFRFSSLNLEQVLQSLREFVSERHGRLEQGWRVEFRQSTNGFETYAVYCAPDGKIFETMSDVANHLGLPCNDNTMEPDLRNGDGSLLPRNGLHLPKRRKLTKLPIGNGLIENKDILSGRLNNGFTSHLENEQLGMRKSERNSLLIKPVQEEKEVSGIHHFHEGLPLQYEDFFVLSLGKVDARASYHNSRQISPVGYRSCWHDKITGSLFLCHVLDGGDSGPVFNVRRFSCSAIPVPYGSTILQRRSWLHSEIPQKEKVDRLTTSDEECCIETILTSPCFPLQGDCDSLSWLLGTASERDGQKANHPESDFCSLVGEEIGEFSVDGSSSSVVWEHVSQKLADACRQIYKQSGSLKLFCKHAIEGVSSFNDIVNDINNDTYSSLHKFCSLLGSLKVPTVVESDDELNLTVDAIKYWLGSDRFGLDVEFVQELIEQFADVIKCSQYESLERRNGPLKAPLVQNGLLLINGRSIELCQQDTAIDSLYRKYRTSCELARVVHSRPPGKHFGGKLPPYLVGDVLQAWELMHRFGEILRLEPLNFHELEAELLSPWFKDLPLHGSCDGDSSGIQCVYADGHNILGEQISPSSGEIDQPEENRFINLATASVREYALVKLNLGARSQCTGLRRAHMSILDVLVSELQIKVAAMVDPSIDGESKSRRGRRRDVDSSILAIRPKLNLLPINELTWPELARRYTLAVLSMDGNLDSAEIGTRDCGKVFRCLQGDGGLLCGSLVGVAGIEADALLLAEATKQIYGCPSNENDHLTIEDDDPEPVSTSERIGDGDGNIPDWALVLEPVKKLPTNVGTRIRKCVYEALEKDPPDWARKKLEHSISKEVYKGNASGPTKKAVLSVLADAVSKASQLKVSKGRKKKTVVSKSDIVMRQCRILLRRAASADDEKMFCNLLGRNLMSTVENDDEGLLGSPGMVPRPLDFRTIDLRLAVGVYGGSHEAFLEDVRELWKNIAIAHADQPELVQIAEALSKNFESLYHDEVIVLVGKLEEYSKLEHKSPEAKKEILDVFASTSDIPKAPWDEGVCKVCGVDKDDDSVLLCDTCDAEYHTYCLNPPLARIPEGNWYCPSCVSGVSVLAGNLKSVHFIGRKRRKYHGDGIRNYLEELTRLCSVMEQKDYWDFSVDERIVLLKYLCDEVLNSIVIRQHLEQCFEISADLQPKLRTLYSECKSLKLQEDALSTKLTKLGPGVSNVLGDCSLEGHVGVANQNVCEEAQPFPSERCDHNSSVSNDASQSKEANHLENYVSCSIQIKKPSDLECLVQDTGQVVKGAGASVENRNSDPSWEHQKSEDEVTASSGLLVDRAREGTPRPISDGLEAFSEELKAVRKELSALRLSIASAEVQLLKSSLRMEYLGTDSSGRLYWATAEQGAYPWVIVDGTMSLEPKKQVMGLPSMMRDSLFFSNPTWSVSNSQLCLGGSSAACPFIYGTGCSYPTFSQWVYYDSEAEVKELVKSLNDYDPKERDLKDSIRHSQKMRFRGLHQPVNEDQVPLEQLKNAEKTEVLNFPATKASTVLECKYGPFYPTETMQFKQGCKRSRGTNDEKLYRCRCFEPVWSSRHHCFSCHSTFYTVDEFCEHNDGKCQSHSPISEKGKANNAEPSGIPSRRKSDTQQELVLPTDKIQSYKRDDGLPCPYRLDQIGSKFVTNDSIKELVSGIGLIGSEGAPSFVPCMSSYLSDPTLMFKADNTNDIDQMKINEKAVDQSNPITGKYCIDDIADTCAGRFARPTNENTENGKPILRIVTDKKKFAPCNPMALDAYCTVPESSMNPVGGVAAHILRQLKICLLDMEAALPEGGLRLLKDHPDKRRAWHTFVKGANTTFEMVQATIVLEDMIKTDHLKNEWWYWSSLSAAVKTSTMSSLALRIFALDNAIIYDRTVSYLSRAGSLKSIDDVDQALSYLESSEKSKQGRRSSRRKRDADG